MMDHVSVNNYEDPIMSTQSLFSADTKLASFTDGLNQPMLQSATNSMISSSPTYAALEPVYPETSLSASTSQYFGHCNSSIANVQTIYTYAANLPVSYTDLPSLHPALYRDPDLSHISKDEGLGSSSPSSYSSSSPPLVQSQTLAIGQTIPSRPSSNYDYSHRSSSSSPASTVSLNYSTAPECSNCGNRFDIYWYNTHYLCRQCLPERPSVVTAPVASPDQENGGKRKRSSGTARNLNQVCTNCEATNSKLWRRSISTGDTVCNACGLYEKLHHVPRPKSMRKDSIQTRKRKTKACQSPKSKKSPKKPAKKLQEITVEQQQQYTPNAIQYTLPNYQNLQLKNLHPEFNSHPTPMIPAMSSHQSLYLNYRPEMYRHDIYNSVPPNDIINVSSSMPSPSMQFTNS